MCPVLGTMLATKRATHVFTESMRDVLLQLFNQEREDISPGESFRMSGVGIGID